MAGGELPSELRPPLAAAMGAALVSTLASLPLLDLLERRAVLRGLALYRVALGVTVLARARQWT